MKLKAVQLEKLIQNVTYEQGCGAPENVLTMLREKGGTYYYVLK